ncbi:2-amino-4-hydroxy-6-hydroxymethyldihydropteridine diphosphokinase [Naumannella cuiyingiana]|uniref:2-amino-4-hydroxy-6-hydroxymethyldihydropteridine diphosphokinase n=1 Tax=Naumannella cuiyingiana TaxID=1347891 RepID=A0A7Z0ILA7_9ACTN|nr:2-amino-4-hydroxy-6-hydroxymethyldihydropteridine diphosphokinase [Naumannella cuiyingiana]NYI71435.1 2-amino-4-hydroxy-6-hydroxymethyldihydropteridine diphosphokinase [Naumannella cuiyingiana]
MTSPNPFAIDADTLSGMKPIRQVVFSLGSSLGDRQATLSGAVQALEDTPDLRVVDISSVYETTPVGGGEGDPDFYNIVVIADTTMEPRTLLERANAIEDAFGRSREDEQNAPRTLDVDLIMVGKDRVDDDTLTLPHPRAHERAFVLVPWAEIEPAGELPGHGAIAELLTSLDASGVRRLDDVELDR